jgi:hypothetical protein
MMMIYRLPKRSDAGSIVCLVYRGIWSMTRYIKPIAKNDSGIKSSKKIFIRKPRNTRKATTKPHDRIQNAVAHRGSATAALKRTDPRKSEKFQHRAQHENPNTPQAQRRKSDTAM